MIDRRRAVRATVITLAVVAVLVVAQAAVVAALTGGQQPSQTRATVPTSPTADAWDSIPGRRVTLSKQTIAAPFGGGSVDTLHVQVVENATHVGFRLTWTDPTFDDSLAGPREYSDAAAVMLHDGTAPPITMGAAGTPVNVWYWRASWEGPDEAASWTGDMYAYPHRSNATMPGRAVDNPLSRVRDERLAQNYYVRGFGSLSNAPVQPVHARGTRTDDGWSVVFWRARSTNGTYDAGFADGTDEYLAFAVWNGSAGEADGEKSLTMTFTRLDRETGRLGPADAGPTGTPPTQPDGGAPWIPQSVETIAWIAGAVVLLWAMAYAGVTLSE
jgi:DMSO reductase family type II enzyme heme b subunit